MKQYLKRSTAWLLCLAMLLSLVGGIPGSFISKVSAAETESTETTDELSGSYCFTFDGATDLDSLFADGWEALSGSTNIRKAFSIVEEDGNKVLKWDASPDNPDGPPTGAYGIGTPLIRVTPGATVVANAEMKTPSNVEKTATMFLYFYDANGDKLSTQASAGKSTAGVWGVHTVSAVAPNDAAYARAMAYNGTSCDDVCYFDNIIVREQITTVSTNGFAADKKTSKWSSIDIDFEDLHSLNGVVNLGWTLAGGGANHELVEEADGNKALRMIGKNVYSPLVDVRDMTAIRAMMEVKGNTAMTLFTYYFDENGNTTLSKIDSSEDSTSAMGAQDATKWLRYSSKNIALPEDTAYVMFMLYASATTDLLIDNFKVIDANEDHNNLNYDFENDTMYSLYYDGWTHSSTAYNGSMSVVADPDNAENYVMQLQKPSNLAATSVVNIYSPYVKVDGLSTIRVSAEGKTDGGNTMLYVYFYQADKSTTVSAVPGQATNMNLANKNSIDLTVPDGAVYANIRIDNGGSYAASYYDNISITCAHNYTSEVTKAATCTEKGVTTYTCSCGDTYTEEIDMIDHTPAEAVVENNVGATCTDKGSYDTVVYCSVCNAELSRETTETDVIAHTPAEAVKENIVGATCTDKGSYDTVVYCSVCNAELSRETTETDVIAHTPAEAVKENIVGATCSTKGSYDSVVYCSVCNAELSRDTIETEMIAHTPAEAVKENIVDATCSTKGSYDSVIYCSVCNAELSRETTETDMIAHTPAEAVIENNVDATCTTKGSYDTVVYCSVCDAEISRDTIEVPMTDHTPAAPVIENNVGATCTTEGSYDTVVYCSVCDAEISRVTTTVDVLDHSFTNYVSDNNATVYKDGTKTAKCDNCEATDTITDEGTKLTAVAQNGEKLYTTLAEAYADAKDNDTITLLVDASGAGIVIDKDITIDFGGKTYTFTTPAVGSKGTTTNGFQILKNNEVTLKNGTLKVAEEYRDDYYILVQNYANLKVINMTLDGTNLDKYAFSDQDSYTLSVSNGTAVVENTTIIANNDGDLAYALDSFDSTLYTGVPTVTLKGESEINGNIEVTGGNMVLGAGTVTGKLVYDSGTVTKDAAVVIDAPADYKWDENGTLVAKNYVAAINGTAKYESLSEALAEAESGDVVTLLADATIEANTTLAAGVTYEIPAGLTLTVAAGVTVDAADTATLNCAGTIVVAGKADISNLKYGDTFGAKGGKLTITATGEVVMLNEWATVWSPITDKNLGGMLLNCETGAKATCGTNSWTLAAEGWKHDEHSYTSEQTKDPTCTEAGETTYTCTAPGCGHSYTEPVAMLPHTNDKYEDNGDGTHKLVCSVCGAVEIASADHTYDNAQDTTCNDCGAVRVVGPVYDANVNFSNLTMNMESSLKLSFQIDPNDIKGVADYYAILYKAGGYEEKDVTVRINKDQMVNTYFAEFPMVIACDMGEKIEATLYVVDADGTVRYGKTISYSILDYLNMMMGYYENIAKDPSNAGYEAACKWMQLAVETLNYGAAAQTEFGYKTDALVNAGLTNEQKAFALAENPKPEYRCDFGSDNRSKEIVYTSLTLNLQDRVYGMILIDTANLKTAEKEALYAEVRDPETGALVQKITFAEMEAGGGSQYWIPISAITPANMTKIYTVQVFAGEAALSTLANYSIDSYASLYGDAVPVVTMAALRYGAAAANALAK